MKPAANLAVAIILIGASPAAMGASPTATPTPQQFYLPDAAASKIVSVATAGQPAAEITILTEAVAIKEAGPKETVKKFGEVYAFSPEFIAVHRDEPTQLTFWNLQPDDEHDFMLTAPGGRVLMHVKLPPLTKMSWVFTFHDEGVFPFHCAVHQPAMSGQVLVLPPRPQTR